MATKAQAWVQRMKDAHATRPRYGAAEFQFEVQDDGTVEVWTRGSSNKIILRGKPRELEDAGRFLLEQFSEQPPPRPTPVGG